jgi:bifunctional non-homologous end joining protein LigD
MGLQQYYRKRDFKKTAEPRGQVHKPHKGGGRFVIQKHAASRLHYDFRLEMEGVLRSWAVPKGPSLDTRDKRLAVQVEDHPIEYGTFEGIIPQGEYGGGTVMLWDHGDWIPKSDNPVADWHKGTLKFTLRGKKLQGDWMLLRLGKQQEGEKQNWLLIKEKDEHVRPSEECSVTDDLDRSVTPDRGLEEIASGAKSKVRGAKGGMNVWNSNRPPKEEKRASAKKHAARRTAKTTREDSASLSDLPGARKAAMPDEIKSPQLATLVKTAPSGDDWIHEIKFDGYRIIAFIRNGKAHLITRNGNDWTAQFSTIARAVEKLNLREAILDGEVVRPGVDGATDFQALQNAMSSRRQDELVYYAFDVLHLNGYNLTQVPTIERKRVLQGTLEASSDKSVAKHIRYSEHFEREGAEVLQSACTLKLEGIISKRRDAPYAFSRNENWLKTKCIQRQEFVIGGYTDPEGGRSKFGALLVGVPTDKGNGEMKLKFAGKVGTGFSNKSLEDIARRMRPLEQAECPFVDAPTGAFRRTAHWIKPQLVGEVEFTEFTSDGKLRHPSFQGLREDKPADQVVAEKPKSTRTKTSKSKSNKKNPSVAQTLVSAHPKPGSKRSAKKSTSHSTSTSAKKKEELEVMGIRVTSPNKILFPEQGLTKEQLVRYYEAVAPYMFPLIKGRPLTLVRCPEGRGKPCFFQRHTSGEFSEAIEPIRTTRKSGEEGYYITMRAPAGVIDLAQYGVLEIHCWNARMPNIEKPDQIVFDMDPDPEVGFAGAVQAAKRIKPILEQLGFVPFLKTTGGKGLHVVVPIKPTITWDQLREFSEAVSTLMVRQYPDDYLITMSKAKRKGKVFIDYLRNAREASAIAPYSTRSREGAPVSVPIAWSELTSRLDPAKFTIETVPGRMAKLKADPWKEFEKSRRVVDLKPLGKM